MRRKVMGLILACCLLLISAFPACADEDAGEGSTAAAGLTIQQAIDMAKASSSTIKNLDMQIERSELVRDKLSDNLQYIPIPEGEATTSAENAFTSLVRQDYSLQSSKYDKSMAEDQIEYSVNSAYTGVLSALANLEYNKKNLENEQFLIKVARLSAGLGITSPYTLDVQELSYKSAQDSVAASEIDMKKAYETFNKLIGLNPGDRPNLIDKPDYEVLEVGDLDGEISRIIDSNPQIWQADQSVALAILTWNYYDSSGTSAAPLAAIDIDVKKAELAASDARTAGKQALRTLYNTISSYETSYPAAQQALYMARENLRIVKVKYEIGMATQGDVIAAELAVESKAKAIDSIVYAHELAKMAFKKPWSA